MNGGFANPALVADSIVDICGALGLAVAMLTLRRRDPRGALTTRFLVAMGLVAALFLLRGLSWWSGSVLLEGLRWAVEQEFEVINMSLSTTRREFAALLHELADTAYFRRTVLVASAHNMPVESFPWRFSSVISVGSHELPDPFAYFYNPDPPVEFFAHGVDVEVAWVGGGTLRSTGNSFATPHVSAICALVLAKHPGLTPFQLKSILSLTANNVGGDA